MPMQLLNNPQITGLAGIITSITNAMEPGANEGSWGIDQVDGAFQGSRTYTNTLRILTSHAYVGPIAIINALIGYGVVVGAPYAFPLPEFGLNAHVLLGPTEIDSGSFIQRFAVTAETDDGRQWLCRIEYGPWHIQHQLGNTNITYGSIDPTDMEPIVRWTTAKFQRYYPVDVNGNAFINYAGDPLENPPPREESTGCLTIIINQEMFSEPFAQSFRDTINGDVWLGFDPHQVKCKDIDGTRVYSADYGYFWVVKYEFEFRIISFPFMGMAVTLGWEDPILNAGFKAFGGSSGVAGPLLVIKDATGQPVPHPMMLNPNGTCTFPTAGPPPVYPQPYYIVFQNYKESTFANLNIPQDILYTNQ